MVDLLRDVLGVMRTLAAEGMTMPVVTHEIQFARKVADRVELPTVPWWICRGNSGGSAEQWPIAVRCTVALEATSPGSRSGPG